MFFKIYYDSGGKREFFTVDGKNVSETNRNAINRFFKMGKHPHEVNAVSEEIKESEFKRIKNDR